jgi:hypothetical protein
VEAAYGEEEATRIKLREKLIEGKSEEATKKVERVLERLTSDVPLSRLLCIKEENVVAGDSSKTPAIANVFANVRIDADAIYEFNRIMWEPGFPTTRPQTLETATSDVGSGTAPGASKADTHRAKPYSVPQL